MSINQEWISRRVTRRQDRESTTGRIAGASAPTAGPWRGGGPLPIISA